MRDTREVTLSRKMLLGKMLLREMSVRRIQ